MGAGRSTQVGITTPQEECKFYIRKAIQSILTTVGAEYTADIIAKKPLDDFLSKDISIYNSYNKNEIQHIGSADVLLDQRRAIYNLLDEYPKSDTADAPKYSFAHISRVLDSSSDHSRNMRLIRRVNTFISILTEQVIGEGNLVLRHRLIKANRTGPAGLSLVDLKLTKDEYDALVEFVRNEADYVVKSNGVMLRMGGSECDASNNPAYIKDMEKYRKRSKVCSMLLILIIAIIIILPFVGLFVGERISDLFAFIDALLIISLPFLFVFVGSLVPDRPNPCNY